MRTIDPNEKREWSEIRESTDPLDRLIYYINGLSPHNLWKARGVIEDYAREREADVAKAYGGCQNCFGKAYTTVIEYAGGADDFGGDGIPPYRLPLMRFCSCERGQQLRAHLRAAVERAKPYQAVPFNPYNGNDPTVARYDALSEYEANLKREFGLLDDDEQAGMEADA